LVKVVTIFFVIRFLSEEYSFIWIHAI